MSPPREGDFATTFSVNLKAFWTQKTTSLWKQKLLENVLFWKPFLETLSLQCHKPKTSRKVLFKLQTIEKPRSELNMASIAKAPSLLGSISSSTSFNRNLRSLTLAKQTNKKQSAIVTFCKRNMCILDSRSHIFTAHFFSFPASPVPGWR